MPSLAPRTPARSQLSRCDSPLPCSVGSSLVGAGGQLRWSSVLVGRCARSPASTGEQLAHRHGTWGSRRSPWRPSRDHGARRLRPRSPQDAPRGETGGAGTTRWPTAGVAQLRTCPVAAHLHQRQVAATTHGRRVEEVCPGNRRDGHDDPHRRGRPASRRSAAPSSGLDATVGIEVARTSRRAAYGSATNLRRTGPGSLPSGSSGRPTTVGVEEVALGDRPTRPPQPVTAPRGKPCRLTRSRDAPERELLDHHPTLPSGSSSTTTRAASVRGRGRGR